MLRVIVPLAILIALCLVCPESARAGDPDSLVQRFTVSRNPDEKAVLAYQILVERLSTNPADANPFLLAAVADTVRVGQMNLANCYKGLSLTFYYQGAYDSAVMFADRAIFHYTSLELPEEANKVEKNKALSLSGKGLYAEAIESYMKTLTFFRSKNDTLRITGTLNDMGNTYLKLRNFHQGLKLQREALYYLRYFDSPATLGNVLNSIAYTYDIGNISRDSAVYYYTKSLEVKTKHGNIYSIINTKSNLCVLYDADGELRKAIDCNQELIVLQKQVNDQTGLVRSNINLAETLSQLRNYNEAIICANEALLYAAKVGDLSLLAEAYGKLAKVRKARNEPGLALAAYEKHLAYRDSAFYARRNEATIEMAARYELEKKNREIAQAQTRLVSAENEKLASALKIRSRNGWIAGLSALLIIGIAFGVVVVQRVRYRKESEKAAAVLAERDRGVKAIIDAQEDERTRIARDLHDGVGNELLGLQMEVRRLHKVDDTIPDLVVERMSAIIDEVRNVSHAMMPKVLREFGCVPAIQEMLDRSLTPAGIRNTFEFHRADKRYDQRIETAVYRIAQELINNIVKHSGADRVMVQLIETANTLVLFVEDNGRGLDGQTGTDGIGMSNIRTRLAAINGEIHMSGGQESGMVASIRIPLT